MSEAKTATVEVLTAEVRVLMVGSRQVTLSVAKQLDFVPAGEIDPFGRIRMSDSHANRLDVIGSASGVLVRSKVTRSREHCGRSGYGSKRCYEYLDLQASLRQGQDETVYGILAAHDDHYWYSYDPDEEIWEFFEDHPLIVLAGLR